MKKLASLLIGAFIGFGSAQAALVKTGNVILDTNTNLQWLTLDQTFDMSYSQVAASVTNSSSALFGYQIATMTQVQDMVRGLGYAGGFSSSETTDAASRDAVRAMFNAFGKTGSNCCNRTDGMVFNADGGGADWVYFIPDYTGYSSYVNSINNLISASSVFWNGSNGNEMGTFLVRTAEATSGSLPEPTGLALAAVALAGLGLSRRKRA